MLSYNLIRLVRVKHPSAIRSKGPRQISDHLTTVPDSWHWGKGRVQKGFRSAPLLCLFLVLIYTYVDLDLSNPTQIESSIMKITTILAASILAVSSVHADATCRVVKERVTIGDQPSAFVYWYEIYATNVEDIAVSTFALNPTIYTRS